MTPYNDKGIWYSTAGQSICSMLPRLTAMFTEPEELYSRTVKLLEGKTLMQQCSTCQNNQAALCFASW